MDRTTWRMVVSLARALCVHPGHFRNRFTDADILLTYLYAVLEKRPASWATRRESWPLGERGRRRPSPARLSRRLPSPPVQDLLSAVAAFLTQDARAGLVHALDGKCLTVSAHSRDATATFSGRGLRGYKLHALCDLAGRIAAWRVTPMHCHEAVIARRVLLATPLDGYVLADANYDHARLYRQCQGQGLQLVTPRAASRVGRGVKRGGTAPSRRRAIDLIERSATGFGPALLGERRVIERVFARLDHHHAIGRPPPWVRGIARVRLWMTAVTLLDQARITAHDAA
jgi:hypothetical protein